MKITIHVLQAHIDRAEALRIDSDHSRTCPIAQAFNAAIPALAPWVVSHDLATPEAYLHAPGIKGHCVELPEVAGVMVYGFDEVARGDSCEPLFPISFEVDLT